MRPITERDQAEVKALTECLIQIRRKLSGTGRVPLHGNAKRQFDTFLGPAAESGHFTVGIRDSDTKQILLETSGTSAEIAERFAWWLTKSN